MNAKHARLESSQHPITWLGLLVGLCSVLWVSGLRAEEADYRFERMLPQLEQPWYFENPNDIALAPDGSFWVVDTGNHRIQHFQNDGSFIAQFGSKGSAAGQFNSPLGIAIAPDGSVWVADTQNQRIQHLKVDGSVIVKIGSSGSAAGQFKNPDGIAVAADGSVWVVDSGNNRIQHFQANGSVLGQFGGQGSAAGQFSEPSGIAVATDGSVWVADSGNNRLQHFQANGSALAPLAGFGAAEHFYHPSALAFAADGSLWVADTFNHRMVHVKTDGSFIAQSGSKGAATGQFDLPNGIAVAADGSVWVADTLNQRIQHLQADGSFMAEFRSFGTAAGQFNGPVGITIAPDGSVWVADSHKNRIQHLQADGTVLAQFDNQESVANGPFYSPFFDTSGIAAAPDGSVWRVDPSHDRIQHLQADGGLIAQFGSYGSAAGQFSSPASIAFAPDGSVWVADTNNDRIQHLKADGSFIAQFGSEGAAAGQFSSPSSIAVAADGSVWVVDSYNHRIEHFKADGSFIAQFGSKGSAPGQFLIPYSIALAPDGSLWVTDGINDRIQHLKADGSFIAQFGGAGSAAGQFNFATFGQSGIAVARDGSLWVTDTSNNRIQKFVPRTTQSLATHPYKAIILAGGGPTIGKKDNAIWEGTWRVATKAYRALTLQSFKVHDEIAFLTAGDPNYDLDMNNKFDDLFPASKDQLRSKITDWAKDANDVVIYLADHGGPGKFQVNGSEIMTAEEFNSWVSTLQQQIPGKVTVIVEACNSGSFMAYLKSAKRYVLTSAQSDQAAVISNQGLNSFSYTFWSEIATNGAKVQPAFKAARQAMSATLIDHIAINAQTDDNGDGVFDEQDYAALGDYCLGNCNLTTAGAAPTLQPLNPNKITLNNTTSLDLSIKVEHLQALSEVWVLVQRPDDPIADSSVPLNFEKVALNCNKQDQCTGKYTRFDTQGNYTLQFYAMDTNKDISLPETLTVTQTQGKAAPTLIPGVNPTPVSEPSGKYPVEYDEQNQLLHLVDVVVNGQDYQADFQFQDDLFVLIPSSVKAIDGIFLQSAKFDVVNGFLTIPLAHAFGQDYTAKLKHQGDFKFSLESIAPK